MTDLIERAEAMAERLGIDAKQLRDFWANSDGTSLHLCCADDLDQAAALIRELIAQVKADALAREMRDRYL